MSHDTDFFLSGVYGQCSTPPMNLAVYEGNQNIIMTCSSPTKVSYVIKATIYETNGGFNVTQYDDIVAPDYTNLFDVNPNGLIIKIAQGNATIPPISTAGIYIINYRNSTNKTAAKLVIARKFPYYTGSYMYYGS